MKLGLTFCQKIFITFACFTVAFIGFMVKLPSAFRHMDKELHATFYFLAAAFFCAGEAEKIRRESKKGRSKNRLIKVLNSGCKVPNKY